MNVLLLALLVAAAVVIALLLIRDGLYRARHKWTDDDLKTARVDSINRSRSTVSGKVGEHFAPLLPEFLLQFNPKDARFLGSPVDFVVFDGLDAGKVTGVCFVVVKTGRATLTARERQIRNAVAEGNVSFQTLAVPGLPDAALDVLDVPDEPLTLAP
jgi:predicted Holliday junction resolvase-like endonuclease